MSQLKNQLALMAFGFVGLIWGSNFVFMKLASEHISPIQIVFIRVLFGFIPIALFATARNALHLSHLKHGHHFFVMGLLATVIYYFGFAKGTALLSSGIAGAISGAIPIFSLLAALLLLKEETITQRKLLGTLLGFIGVVLLARPFAAGDHGQLLEGTIFMVTGSLSVGVSFVYAKRFVTGLKISPLALTTYQLGAGLVILLFTTDFSGITNIKGDKSALLSSLIGLGILGTGVAYLCYYFIIEKLGALTASSVTYIPPAVALPIGAFVLGEPIELRDYASTTLILIGVFIASGIKIQRNQR